jgi:RNA polymerase sigma factor (sigma-70 family)
MTTQTLPHRVGRTSDVPSYLHHPQFEAPNAIKLFGSHELLATHIDYDSKYMPDEVTRDHAKRMHYAAFRSATARARSDRNRWLAIYFELRTRIVLGNRKLIYRAVQQRTAMQNYTDDLIGDSYVVLIQVVAAFNPWLNVRFSTYAYTCLVRALTRTSRRFAADRLSRSLSFESLPDGEPRGRGTAEPSFSSGALQLDEFLREDHPLLSDREKSIIARRFSLNEGSEGSTLEEVGRAVGLSKERVRQVQATAIQKLRLALSTDGQ